MAKARLKVFRTQLGFDEVIVATPSQAKALQAWDVRQNLFAEKMAGLFEDDAAGAAAREQPGVVLRRPVGSSEPFTEGAQVPLALPAAESGGRKQGNAAGRRRKTPLPPDRSALDKAERALVAVNENAADALKALAAERQELDQREREVKAAADKARAKAKAAVEKATRAFKKAGGIP